MLDVRGENMDAVKHKSDRLSVQLAHRPSDRSLRILGICVGSVENLDSATSYGSIVASLFGGLARQHQVTLRSVDLRGVLHYLNRLRSFILQHPDWRRYSLKNPWVFRTRSYLAHRTVGQLGDNVDLVLQWQGLNAPFIGKPLKPYGIYTDFTTKLRDAHRYPTYRGSVWRSEQEREAYYRLEGEAYRKARRIFTFSELVRRSMIEDYGVEPERVVTVGVGVCLEPIDPVLEKRYDSRQIVFIGKDSAFMLKGVPNLLAGFARVRAVIPDAQLLLIGLNPDRVPPQPGVVNLGVIHDRQRLRQVLEGAALYAMTPLTDASPGAVREAMAMKLPVVASDVDGIPEMVIDGETGYLVPPEEPGQLAEAMIALLKDEDKLRMMGERGYVRVQQHFTWDGVLSKLEPHLYSIVRKSVACLD
jgi:glycosyltransferase involved in cell wall biosynthesis